MKYDFTSIIDRKGKDAIAVDVLPNLLGPKNPIQVRDGLDMIPMWIADMNFPALPTITEAIIERAKHPTYGYFKTRDEYFDSIIRWHETRNHVTGLEKEHIGYENGVLGGVASALHVFAPREITYLFMHRHTLVLRERSTTTDIILCTVT